MRQLRCNLAIVILLKILSPLHDHQYLTQGNKLRPFPWLFRSFQNSYLDIL